MPLLTRRLIQMIKQARYLRTDDQIQKLPKFPYLYNLLAENLNVTTLLKSKEPLTSNDWMKAREDLVKLNYINKKSVDATIIHLCDAFKNVDAITSYVKFLKSNNLEINLYLAGIYAHRLKEKSKMSDSDKQEICALYDDVRKRYPILDAYSCVTFICALCATDRWEDSIELLNMMETYGKIKSPALSAIIKAAFVNNKPEIGWKYFSVGAEKEIVLNHSVLTVYLEYCTKMYKDKELVQNIFKMFELCRDKNIPIHKYILDDYLTVLQSLGYTHSETKIQEGKCQNCSYMLPEIIISKEEFEEMSRLFMEKVLVRDNVYYNSSPEEFKNFLKFLKHAVPYDVVIDGLNAAYSIKTQSNAERSTRLAEVVQYFVNKDKKILLLGRKHMHRYKDMPYIRHNTKMFLVENSSYDDPNVLYATFYGGKETCFISGDLMRQHKHLMPANLRSLFKIWQLSHQYLLAPYSPDIKNPIKFETKIHADKNGFHVPYFLGDTEMAADSYDSASNWICLRKKSK